MKHLLFAIGLVATLAGCSKKEEPAPAPDPDIGHWQSESEITYTLDATGKVVTPPTTYTPQGGISLDATPTTMRLYSGTTPGGWFGYTRDGENLLYAGLSLSDPARYYARSLTANSFTLEKIFTDTDGKRYFDSIPFHR